MSETARKEKLLKRINDRRDYLEGCWLKPRENRKKNMRFIMGDPWEPAIRRAREAEGRPCDNEDELNQFVNRAINNIRMNKRGVKVEPEGNGADDQSAELRQDIIRTAEYKSQAEHARVMSFEHALQGGYGFRKVVHRYKGKSFNQEVAVDAILNPDSILFDWDCKEPSWCDAVDCFEFETMTETEFARRFPKAEKHSFTEADRAQVPKWLTQKQITVGAYWYIDSQFTTIYQLDTGEVVDNLADGQTSATSREYEEKTLKCAYTNGLEILAEEVHPGELLPIIPCIGQELSVDSGNGSERVLRGMIDLACDPQMGLAYGVSQEHEEAKLTPRVPIIGYVGQFQTDKNAWDTLTEHAYGYVQADPVADKATGHVLPLPQRTGYVPNFAAYEMFKEAKKRAIQAAMAVTSLPTAAQRQNEKSKIALDKIDEMQQVGSFHFADNYDRSVALEGRVMDGWINAIYDNEREMQLRQKDDSYKKVTINTEQPYVEEEGGQPVHYPTDKGDHHVTISTGPAFTSTQEEYKNLLNTFAAKPESIPQPGTPAAKITAKLIKAMNLGVKGEEIADILDPPEDPNAQPAPSPEVMQAMQQMKQELDIAHQVGNQMQGEITELQQKIDAKVIDNAAKKDIEIMKIEADLAKAEINTKAQHMSERIAFIEDMMKQLQIQRHDAAMQAMSHGHDADMADQQAQVAAQQTEQPQPGALE